MRALIVDDEPLARRRLVRLLADHPEVDVVGEAEDASSAVQSITELEPEVVFLDVEMPGATGFDVLEALDQAVAPAVVFVTAFSNYAVAAFDAHAVDYLLKPFDEDRLDQTLERVRERLQNRKGSEIREELLDLVAVLKRGNAHLERVAVTTGKKTLILSLAEVDWVGSDGNYVVLHQGDQKHYLRSALSAFEKRLDPTAFLRVHRSAIVAVRCVRELRTLRSGKHVAVLLDGTELPVSQRHWGRIMRNL